MRLIPGLGANMPYDLWPQTQTIKQTNNQTNKKKKKKWYCNKINKDFKTKKIPKTKNSEWSLQYNLHTFAKFPVCLFEPSVDLIMADEKL